MVLHKVISLFAISIIPKCKNKKLNELCVYCCVKI